ncbi:MAG TPA: MarR family transcriptional regulator [Ktedonobacteraceae bacterium]|nr:MarR family transcriptional regulator [Ktedonobacteraceae bacterium]
MVQRPVQHDTRLAEAILDITPKLLLRLGADVPVDDDSPNAGPEWHDVIELRATPGQLSLLRILADHERCTMQELAEHLAVAPSTATAMVKRLLAQGYVERTHDDVNWRTVWVKPTESGRKAVDVYHNARLASLQCRLKKLSVEEREHIAAALPALLHLTEL